MLKVCHEDSLSSSYVFLFSLAVRSKLEPRYGSDKKDYAHVRRD